jgi:hypothetical protein
MDRSFMSEIDLVQVDDKWYCESCLKKLGHIAIDIN